ncbi:MAG: alpha/beta hydrolase [Acidaminococcaceae bacterium]|nr:alpha/beta hydrolase [Acidaminococcaceae bacterium]
MSIQFIITKLLVRLSGSKRITGLPRDKMLKQIRRRNKLNRFFVPGDRKFVYSDKTVHLEDMDGTADERRPSADFHCLSISHRDKPKRAVLCVYGGGLLLAPPRMFIGFAKKMAANTGADVWFPYYPLCDEYTIRDSVRMLYEVYASMRREYDDVRWYGYSSGGALLLLLGSYLNEIKSPLPMPQRLVLISPGGIPSTEEEWEKMQSLNGKDIMLSAQYMKTIQPLLSHGNATVPRWMQSCEGADFSNLPETWIYYGTAEVLSAKAAAYDKMLTSAGVRHHLKMAPGMPHCYCTTVFFPEAKADYEETMRILRED